MSKTRLFDSLIFEGPDGSGKSATLISVESSYKIHIHHSGGPVNNMGEYVERISHNLVSMRSYPMVAFDRVSPISESVYGQVLRNRSLIQINLAINHLKLYNPVIIYCNPGEKVLRNNLLKQREKDHKPTEHIDNIIDRAGDIWDEYQTVMSLLRGDFPILEFDYTNAGDWDQLGRICRCAGF